ncbi:Retrovirus-related Pol polyprotein from transposon opus [Dictyocoela muelleri]|nr:Retrovirus-related Pol polyprotein from transposon opus [Dictyocoela muelleri]
MKFFSIIYLKDGFFHVKLHDEDKLKTTFLDAYNRPMQFTVMPQGFKNSPAIFQKGMNIVLEDLLGKICYCYIDDIIVFGRDKDEHNNNYNTVIKKFNEYKFIINKDKLVYCKEEVNFLGYSISLNKVKPLLERTLGIKNFPIPTSKRKLRGFLGLINFDRNFI